MISRTLSLCTAALLLALAIPTASTYAAGAANDHTVLFLAATVPNGMSSVAVQQALALGYSVELASDADWLAKSTADFSTYRALIFADPECTVGLAPLTAAEASINTWGPAVDGNIEIVGTDPSFHTQWIPSAVQVVNSGISYVAGTPPAAQKTGMYMSLSCYFNETGPVNAVLVLSYFGVFTVSDNPSCYDNIHITAPSNPAMSGLTDASLSNWNCSIHELFTAWPSNFTPLAIADGLGSVYTAPDGHTGTPYILARNAVTCAVLPTLTINSITPNSLWPPNKQYVDVYANVTVTGSAVNVTRTVTSSEVPSGPPAPLYQDGSDVFHFKLRAARNGNNVGRTYTITFTGTDACGNTVSASTTVVVPHDQGNNNSNNNNNNNRH